MNALRELAKSIGYMEAPISMRGIARILNLSPASLRALCHASLSPYLVRGVACLEIRNNQPWGEMGKMGTFPNGPINIYRYMEFARVGGHHDVELVAYRAPITSQQFEYHSSKKDFIDNPTPQTSYMIWFCDNRDDGHWQEQVLLDGRPLGRIDYTVGGIEG